MYEYLHGLLASKTVTEAVVDVGGVGYRLELSLRSAERLPAPGHEVHLLVHQRLQDDRSRLFAFVDPEERTLFRHLLTVAGIGPSLALALLSGHEPAEIWELIHRGEWKMLARTKGIGAKTAQRACTELHDRALRFITAAASPRTPAETSRWNDAIAALLVLGYSEAQAQKAVETASGTLAGDAGLEELVREALRNT